MKKILFAIVVACMTSTSVMAQNIYNQVVANAKNVVDDPNANPSLVDVCQFKYTAMRYLANTAIKLNGEVTKDFLDSQAEAMNAFVTGYLSKLAKGKDAEQKQVMLKYWRASKNNPLFKDMDKETTQAFIDAGTITPFSLDTDWVKALKEVEK